MKVTKLISLAVLAFSLVSCDDKPNNGGGGGGTDEDYAYVIIGKSTTETADYVLQVESLTSGKTSIKGQGLESPGNRNWMFLKQAAFGFLYSQGDPGATASFHLNDDGEVKKNRDYDLSVSITTRGYYDDYMVLVNSTRSITDPRATFYFVDVENDRINSAISFNTAELADNGKVAYLTDVAQVDDKLYFPYKCINGTGEGNVNTMKVELYDTCWIAVYSYDKARNTLTFEKKITDTGRTSYVSGAALSQHETGVQQIDNGDVYVFSSGTVHGNEAEYGKQLPSGILKIKKGTEEFDADYFFDVTDKSGGYHLYRVWYAGGTKFVMQMNAEPNTTSADKTKFAVVDVASESFSWVSGVPDSATIEDVSKPYASKEEGIVAFALTTTTDTNPFVYVINASTGRATKGIEVEAEGVSGIGKLVKLK